MSEPKDPRPKSPFTKALKDFFEEDEMKRGYVAPAHLEEFLAAHPGHHNDVAEQFLERGYRTLLATNLHLFTLRHRYTLIRRLVENDPDVLIVVCHRIHSYLAAWKEQGRPLDLEKAKRLGNLLFAASNKFESVFDERDEDREEETPDLEFGELGTFTELRTVVLGSLSELHPSISLDVDSTCETLGPK